MVFSTSALTLQGPTPKPPPALILFLIPDSLPLSSLAALRVSMWKRIDALILPLSITIRCMPIITIVASCCWRWRAR